MRKAGFCCVALLGLTACSLFGATVTLIPSADTTLIEHAPDSNLGGQKYFSAGSTGLTPPTRNRGLFRFDVAGAVPAGARIQAVNLTLSVVHQPSNGDNPSPFVLRKMLKPWGEGNKPLEEGGSPGLGEAATAGEATWQDRFAFSGQPWTRPGGQAPEDFSPAITAEVYIYGTADSPYLLPSTPALVADTQSWLDQPAVNYGWILMTEAEAQPYTARRFGSREDPDNAPQLEIHFLIEPKILSVEKTAAGISFQFQAAESQSYTVQYRNQVAGGEWKTLKTISAAPAGTIITVEDTATGGARFYRLATAEASP